MSLKPEQIQDIAHLARIAINDDQAGALAAELSGVLALVEQMQAADTTGISAMAHAAGAQLRLRDDVVSEPDRREAMLGSAPLAEDGYFLVPRVVE